ncbi:MAG TPA: hypothetical protein VMW76_02330 [Bacteroidales bacterium]|nr:hypothetical protein [Bacteroidales bacterium]
MTSEKIIDKCADALGGYDVINNIETIHVRAIYPDHGDVPMEFIMKRPNRSFNPRANLVFDGKRICFLKGRDGKSDPEFAPEGDWKDGEVEIGYHFPAFFEYRSDYSGIDNVDGNQFYKLKVDLPLGAKLTYLIDSETYLTARVMFEFTMSGREINDWRDLGDYKEVDGFKYPHSFTYMTGTGRQNGWVHSVEINASMSDDLFKIPEGIK